MASWFLKKLITGAVKETIIAYNPPTFITLNFKEFEIRRSRN